MPNYCVNKNPQLNGDHEVHDTGTCTTLPQYSNRLDLGWHADCRSAVRKAKETYSKSNGCKHCCNACHTT